MSDSPNQMVYRISNLSKIYKERCVLAVEDLTVQQGEILAIIGPSGSGKSTLLRIMNFLEMPSEGQVEFMGEVFEQGKEMPLALRRRVTTVFQHPILLNRTVDKNVAFALNLHGKERSPFKIRQALDEVGLAKLASQRARTLSAGEAQRVSLARAMVIQPDVLLFDEPTANLDPYNVMLIEQIIQRLNQEFGITIILVTHNLFQAKRLAGRVAFLLEGKIIEINETIGIFQNPKDPRTQSFVHGEMVY